MKLSTLFKASVFGLSLLALPPAQADSTPGAGTAVASRQAEQPVNINRADATTLAGALRGIGMQKAEAIVAYRSEHGPFKSVDDLVNVKGIGEKTLERLRPLVSL